MSNFYDRAKMLMDLIDCAQKYYPIIREEIKRNLVNIYNAGNTYLREILEIWFYDELVACQLIGDRRENPGFQSGDERRPILSQHPPKSSSLTPTRARTEPSGIACVGRLDEPRSPGLQSGESS